MKQKLVYETKIIHSLQVMCFGLEHKSLVISSLYIDGDIERSNLASYDNNANH